MKNYIQYLFLISLTALNISCSKPEPSATPDITTDQSAPINTIPIVQQLKTPNIILRASNNANANTNDIDMGTGISAAFTLEDNVFNACKDAQAKCTAVKIDLIGPSGQSENNILCNFNNRKSCKAKFVNLFANSNYHFQLDETTIVIPNKNLKIIYSPAIITTIMSQIISSTVTISAPDAPKPNHLKLSLDQTTFNNKFASININGNIIDSNGTAQSFILSKSNNYSYEFADLPIGNYVVKLSGLGDAYNKLYYAPIKSTASVVAEKDTNIKLQYTTNTNLFPTHFNVDFAGITQQQTVSFASDIMLDDNDNYQYIGSVLSNNYDYYFPKNAKIVANPSTYPGYTITVNPQIITQNVPTETITYTPIIVNTTYSVTAPTYAGGPLIIDLQNGDAIKNPTVIQLTTSANIKLDPACFSVIYGGTAFATTQIKNSHFYQTTITIKQGSDVHSDYFNFSKTASCKIEGDGTTKIKSFAVTSLSINNTKIPYLNSVNKDPIKNNKKVVGYYSDWAMYSKKYPATKIPFDSLNNIVYAFIFFDGATGNIRSGDSNADDQQVPILSTAMVKYPYLHTSLSFGGWTNGGPKIFVAPMFDQLTSGPDAAVKINNFAKQAVALMREVYFDGIDIDWEWWSNYTVSPSAQMLALYHAVRNELDEASQEDGRQYYLTIATNSGVDKITASETAYPGFWKEVSSIVDGINVMAYDMHGAFDYSTTFNKSYFQAAYGKEKLDPYTGTIPGDYYVKAGLDAYKNFNTPNDKLILGVPFYGRAMFVDNVSNVPYGLEQTILTGAPEGDFDDFNSGHTGIFIYKCIVNANDCSEVAKSTINALSFITINTNPAIFNQFSSMAQAPWAYGDITSGNNVGKIFMTYDDINAIKYKTQKAIDNGFGGIMVWELAGDSDDPKLSLLQNIKNTFNK